MSRKNRRMQTYNSWLPHDLYRLTKRRRSSPYASATTVNPTEPVDKVTFPENLAAALVTPSNPDHCRAKAKAEATSLDDPRIGRGSVWFADLGRTADGATTSPADTHTRVQSGVRPVLIISNDINNRYSPIVTVIPFTGSVKRLDMPTHVRINPGDVCDGCKPSVIYRSMLLAEQVTAIDKLKLLGYCGIIKDPMLMRRIETALMTQVGINPASQANDHRVKEEEQNA